MQWRRGLLASAPLIPRAGWRVFLRAAILPTPCFIRRWSRRVLTWSSLRGSGIANVTGATGIAGADTQRLSATELPYYTTANGTSFSAPQVAGAIALMLEANPNLTPVAS